MLLRTIAHRLRNHRLPVVWFGWLGCRYCCSLYSGVGRSLCLLSCTLCLSPEFPGWQASGSSSSESAADRRCSLLVGCSLMGLLAARSFPIPDFSGV